MKKIFALTLLTVCSLTACKKDYTCECSGGLFAPSSKTIHDTKENAEKSCHSDVALAVNDPDRACSLK